MFWISKMARHADLAGRMAETVGVDPAEAMLYGELTPEDWRSAVLRCSGCTDVEACEHWLADHADGAAETPDYCRNKTRLDALARS